MTICYNKINHLDFLLGLELPNRICYPTVIQIQNKFITSGREIKKDIQSEITIKEKIWLYIHPK
jgi:hypothetical protein